MNDWRSGLLLRTFQRLVLRVPFVVVLVGGFFWISLEFAVLYQGLREQSEGVPNIPLVILLTISACFLIALVLVMLTISVMRRPLWERHTVGLRGLLRGVLFGVLVLLSCFVIACALIGGSLWLAPLDETPRAYQFLHRSGLIAIVLLCVSPGLFALVVSVGERQGYSTVARIWRIDRAQTVRGVFLIMVLTTCVAAVAIVGSTLALRGIQIGAFRIGADFDVITTLTWAQRALLTSIFTIIAFVTAHVVQYERIREWESGGDVTGVFD